MLQPTAASPGEVARPRKGSRMRTALMVVGVFLLGCGAAAGGAALWVKHNLYADAMRPVKLNVEEQQVLDAKLQFLQAPANAPREATAAERDRTLLISQKEINAYLANQQLGESVKVDLGENRVSATMLVPVPADSGVPLVAGTTLRVQVVLDVVMDAAKKFSLKLADVRVGGLSMPNAWLGDLKGVNLVAENVEGDPALQRFLAGIQEMEVRPDGLRILLSE